MKLLCCMLLGLAGFSLLAAEAPPSTNQTLVTSQITAGSFEYVSNTVVFRQNVVVTEPQMKMTCELLTLYFSTNRPAASTNAAVLGPTADQKVEMIVAETNVVISMSESKACGGKAVFTATNELFVLSGNPLVETAQGVLTATNIFYDGLRNALWGVGGVVVSNKPSSRLFGAGSLGITLPGSKRSPRKTEEKSK
jgi:lipopolysaccharide export system protein LptA